MSKQVFIKRLALNNFKGKRYLAIDFEGNVTTVSGRNGTGKTTVIDAFNWLLFGKDSKGDSDQKFGIKTTDKNGEFIPHLEHDVTGTFEVTDTETGETETRTYRRVLVEDWKERTDPETGEVSEYLKGHHTNYYYNDMPLKTKTEYDRLVTELIPENVFRIITNPAFFLSQHWQDQREMLLQMAGNITDEEIISSNRKFDKLVELLQGKNLDGFQAMIKEDRAKIDKELQKIPTRIDEVNRNTPESMDFPALEEQLSGLSEEFDMIDKAMTSKAEANRHAYTIRQGKQKTINDYRLKQQDILFKAQQEANRKTITANAEHDNAVRVLESLENAKKNFIYYFDKEKRNIQARIEKSNKDVELHVKEQDEIREEWFRVNSEEFNDKDGLICPLFKHGCADSEALQAYHANQAAAREKFYKDKEERLNKITEKGKHLGLMIKVAKDNAKHEAEELAELEEKHRANMANEENMQKEAEIKRDQNPKQATPVIKGEDLPEWVHLQEEIVRITEEMLETGEQEDDTAALRQQRAEVQAKIDAVKKDLQKREQIEQAESRIEELNRQKRELQKEKAQLQGKEDLITDFERAKMEEVERRVNAMFAYVQFKMYRQQIEDAKQVPDCICYIDGVRYADKNTAAKVNAGLDVINTLCSFYNVNAPIFIDNAESVNEFINVSSQLIKLEVTKGEFKLK